MSTSVDMNKKKRMRVKESLRKKKGCLFSLLFGCVRVVVLHFIRVSRSLLLSCCWFISLKTLMAFPLHHRVSSSLESFPLLLIAPSFASSDPHFDGRESLTHYSIFYHHHPLSQSLNPFIATSRGFFLASFLASLDSLPLPFLHCHSKDICIHCHVCRKRTSPKWHSPNAGSVDWSGDSMKECLSCEDSSSMTTLDLLSFCKLRFRIILHRVLQVLVQIEF